MLNTIGEEGNGKPSHKIYFPRKCSEHSNRRQDEKDAIKLPRTSAVIVSPSSVYPFKFIYEQYPATKLEITKEYKDTVDNDN